jgi:peptidoglycan/xylan/chitin deacetylase (PgdA/CDA1 family)
MNARRQRRRHGRTLVVVAAVVGLVLAGPGARAAPVPPPQPPDVLAADPQTVPPPDPFTTEAVGCPPAPLGIQRRAPGTGKTVALTFDDGPGASTHAILRILAANGVIATFFDIGINETVRPATVRAIAAQGHLLGNHSWSHPDMPRLSAAAQGAEMDKATAQQRRLIGFPPCFFRPPYGAADATTLSLARARRMAVFDWSVDTEDWKAHGSGAHVWIDRIIARAEAGGVQAHPVVLMHNQPIAMPATVAALPTIIAFYRDRGYTFVDLGGRVRVRATDRPVDGYRDGNGTTTRASSGATGVPAQRRQHRSGKHRL